MALRMSGHLLVGLSRIYAKKAAYLLTVRARPLLRHTQARMPHNSSRVDCYIYPFHLSLPRTPCPPSLSPSFLSRTRQRH